jgi:hypothetical protein
VSGCDAQHLRIRRSAEMIYQGDIGTARGRHHGVTLSSALHAALDSS